MARYVFIGAGAVGSAIGGLLAQQQIDVLLVARGDHAQAMINNGLTVRCPDLSFTVRPKTVTGPEQARLRVDDVLVLTTKSHQAEAAVQTWADAPVYDGDAEVGRAGERLPILIALNGVAGEEIALRYFDRVYAVCVWTPVVMIEPGEVLVRSVPRRGVFHVGRYGGSTDRAADDALLDTVAKDWQSAAFTVHRPAAVMEWKYRKLISNLSNVFQALLGDTSQAGELKEAADAEARRVLSAAGIAVTSDEDERAAREDSFHVQPIPGEPAELGGSTWQSLVRGTGSIETDYLNGEIALIGRRVGHPAPINARLAGLARSAARNGLRPGAVGVDELTAILTGSE
ncbi:ketopantoate reductase family protein [Microlunatus elymi]|uniref:ketopantoate reductase family protein n=1 Tax=Microlunatus elymi TaxID=2596828 RepID=UPI00143D1005|nr:ketopantoate reductase family protein [Microlunatus elymi]